MRKTYYKIDTMQGERAPQGDHRDLVTLIREAGHAFSYL